MSEIGKSVPRMDSIEKVTGTAKYSGDYNMPNQAYMKILFAHRPHAIVRAIDSYAAEALPGVIAVLTAKDVPVNEYGLISPDQPVLCGPGSDKPYTDRVRFIGDQVALIIADSEIIADQARELIEVDYEDLPFTFDEFEAMQEDATLIHPNLGTNILDSLLIRKGDIETGFAAADVIVEAEYLTPAQEHAFLQPEAGISYIDEEGRVTVVVGGQWAHEDAREIAHALNLPEEKVRVIYPYIGGAFGGREDLSIQIPLGLAVWVLHQRGIHRPVKIIWSREESIIGHHKRHPFTIRSKWGATKEGIITAAEMEIIINGGAYAYTSISVLKNATASCTGIYNIPNIKTDSHMVFTNRIPGGAFRGFGSGQVAFAYEGQIEKLARALDIDPVELRLRNALQEGDTVATMKPILPGVSISNVIRDTALRGGWQKTKQGWQRPDNDPIEHAPHSHLRRGIGFAAAFKNVGFSHGFKEYCNAGIELHGEVEIEKVVLRHATAEVGQGTYVALAQMTADAAGIPLEKVEMILSDTASSADSGSASASRMTFFAGHAILGAVAEARKKWDTGERPAVSNYTYWATETSGHDPITGEAEPYIQVGYTASVVSLDVDVETGQINVHDIITASDVGKAVNPQQLEGQIEGGSIMGLGHTVMEEFVEQDGDCQTHTLSTYLIPTVLDIPDNMQPVILEYPDPRGPWGIRGVGEMPMMPLPPAVAAALYDATGVWFDEHPLTPQIVLAKLRAAGIN